jgi:hypothetical protein
MYTGTTIWHKASVLEDQMTEYSGDTLPAMTGAEMQTTREFLGLTRGWLASDLQMGERRMMRMESG